MLTPRTLSLVAAAAGALAGLPLGTAQACDNDRFPCPIVVDSSAQDSADVPSRAAPAAQSRKKTTSAPRQADRAAAKTEQEASHASTRTKASKPAAHEQADARAKASKPAAQEQADSNARTTAEVAPAWPQPPAQPGNAEIERNANPPAPTAEIAPASATNAVAAPSAPAEAAANAPAESVTATAAADGVHTVDPNEPNELDLAAAAPEPAPAESSWLSWLLVTLGGALAAASTVRLFLF